MSAFDADHWPYQPPAIVQSETTRGEPRVHWIEFRGWPDEWADPLHDDATPRKATAERWAATYNAFVGNLAAMILWSRA